ncbi:CUE domain-containing protein C354.10 isoform X2 [Bactrocera tryoni]|uniref:CUE domain-containing protein C354.10 isoform X2 n=1 Tax=Bactrocera tryoni TaxID=59916 RepID=UPI001A97F6FD|nr:CUE domain-containing protein C354.10 isoform X2 [Bactrocera tryoni]
MEVYDDRPVSVYDNLKTTPNSIHTSTPKAVKRGNNTVPSPAASPLPTRRPTAAAATTTTGGTTAANRATSSPIYADIAFKFNDNNQQLKNQQSQQPHQQQQQQQQQTLPRLTQQYVQQSAAQPVASNFTDQAPTTTATTQNIATNTTLPTQNSNNSTNNYTNSSNQRLIQANASITLPAPSPAPASALAAAQAPIKAIATATPAAMSTTTAASTVAAPRNASPAQRPLSQHSQSELYEASQSIAAVKAALNDAKSKFFGLNGYAQDHPHNNTYSANESRPLQQRAAAAPRLLIDNQYPKVQIVTTAPTPPPKSQPKYQNIPENSAIFRNNVETPPELPPKPPVDAVAVPSRMAATTLPTQTDGAVSTTPNSAAFSTSSRQSNTPSPSPSAPSDAAKVSLSSSHAAYKQIPLNDIDTTQPSQAVYMSTTVPQNIKATQYPNPMSFKYPNLARWLLILEIIVGLLISFLAIWIFCLAPNTAIQYNPYWSGLVLLLAGILGLVLVRYQRIKRHKVRENCFKFLRADSYLLALLAVLLCCVAVFCAALHYARLCADDTHCAPTNILLEHGSCTCIFNANEDELTAPTNSSAAQVANGLLDEEVVPEHYNDQSYKVEYRDLSCKELRGEWITILILSMALNTIGFLLAFAYTVLLFCCRHSAKRPFYTSVHTSTF